MRKTTQTTDIPLLGQAQLQLETSTRLLDAAQEAFVKANANLKKAEEDYETAVAYINQEYAALRSRCKVVPLASK